MAGETILNSFDSETLAAESIEYRRGLWRFVDATIGYQHEGNGISARRDRATAQLWLTRVLRRQAHARLRGWRLRGDPSREQSGRARYR